MGCEPLQDTKVGQAGVNTHPVSLLLWAEVGQDQKGTEAARTSSPPGKHTRFSRPWLSLYIYGLKCVLNHGRLIETNLLTYHPHPQRRQLKLKGRSISRKKWKPTWWRDTFRKIQKTVLFSIQITCTSFYVRKIATFTLWRYSLLMSPTGPSISMNVTKMTWYHGSAIWAVWLLIFL